MLIGEASTVAVGTPFRGRPGAMLASLCGLSLDGFLEMVECINLLATWPGKASKGKGHLFPMDEARAAAAAMDLRGRRVILAGKRVAAAFSLRRVAWLAPVRLGRGEVSCLVTPHPSGIVRWWNDPGNRALVAGALRRLLGLPAPAEDQPP